MYTLQKKENMEAGIDAGEANMKTWKDLYSKAKAAGKLNFVTAEYGTAMLTINPTMEEIAQTFLLHTTSALVKFYATVKAETGFPMPQQKLLNKLI